MILPLTSYKKLRFSIAREIELGAERIKGAYQQEILRTHWNIGRIINESLDQTPSAGNAAIIMRLARDFNKAKAFFYRLIKFYKLYPKLPETGLTLSHYIQLISVKDDKERAQLETKAIRQRISTHEFPIYVRLRHKKPEELNRALPDPRVIPFTRGRLYYYKALRNPRHQLDENRMLVDVGFGIEREVRIRSKSSIQSGEIVCSIKEEEGEDYTVRQKYNPHKEWLYTYKAVIRRIVDADTLIAHIDLGFRTWITQTLRLRSVDVPEPTFALGRKAVLHVQKLFSKCPIVVIKTYKEEKYGRYLIDLFYKSRETEPEIILKEGTYLNQELLDKRMGERY